jgi:dihydropteroate synthase
MGRVLSPSPFFVAGIVNVTPDSFCDGGVSAEPDQAVVTAMRLLDDVSALADPALLEIISQYKPGYVFMHTQGEPRTMQVKSSHDDVVDEVRETQDALTTALTLESQRLASC